MLEMFEIPSDIRDMLGASYVENGELKMDTSKLKFMYDSKEIIHNQTRFIVEREAEIKAYEEQVERLTARIKEEQARMKAMRQFVASSIETSGIKAKFSDVHAVTRHSKSVLVETTEFLPPELITEKVTIQPNKVLIHERIKAGDSFKGVTLLENLSLMIR